MGLYNSVPSLNGIITFDTWIITSFLPIEITTLLLIIGGYLVFKPKGLVEVPQSFTEEYNKLGPLSNPEKFSTFILLTCFCMFLTSKIHGIPDAAIVLIGLFLLSATGVIKASDISPGINWDLVIFIGVSLGLGAVFNHVGLSEWLGSVLIPILKPLAVNPWLFVFGIVIFLFTWRFLDVAILMPTMAILVPAIPTISDTFGVSPLIWPTIFVMVGNSFFLSYTNMFALVAESIAGEKGWKPLQLSRYGLLYFLACMLSLTITIPYWISIGMFK